MRITQQYYNDSQMTDSSSLARALISKPTQLSPMITHLGGKEDQKLTLSMITEGLGNSFSTENIEEDEYEYRVKSRMEHTRPVAETPSSTVDVGKGNAMFTLVFPDRWFIEQYVLASQSGFQARIMAPPTPKGNGFEYTLQPVKNQPTQSVPSDDLKEGKLWAQLFAPVGTDFSRGNASNWTTSATVRHKLSTIRKSYQMSGSAKHKVAEFELPTDNGTTKFWMEHEEWQKMLQWKWELESYYTYGQQSYNDDGETHLKDQDSGYPIVIGPGLLEQVINKETYSSLTENKIRQVVRDLLFGMTDSDNTELTILTGTGGFEEFDSAMKEYLNSNVWTQFNDRTFVTGSGYDLQLEGYFSSYRHIDGHVINLKKNPMYDIGPVAEASEKHPESGLPLESYRMTFIDQSRYDGQPNLVMVKRKNRELIRWAVAGSTVPDGFEGNDLRASDIDGASVHFLKQCGILLRRFDTSLDLQCVKS